jgi:hypothetical protein
MVNAKPACRPSRGCEAFFGRPGFESCPHDLELVARAFNAVAMLVDRHLNFSLRHGVPLAKNGCSWFETSALCISIGGPKQIAEKR